jgi:hypothetical protein
MGPQRTITPRAIHWRSRIAPGHGPRDSRASRLRPPFGTTLFGEIRPAPRLPRSFAASLAHLDRSATSQRWISQDSPLSYAISHSYLNGGTTAWSVRVAEGAAAAAVRMQTAAGRGRGAQGRGDEFRRLGQQPAACGRLCHLEPRDQLQPHRDRTDRPRWHPHAGSGCSI